MKDLKKLRDQIDNLDEKIVKMLNKRAAFGQKVAAIKKRDGKPVYYPARERQILNRVAEISNGPLSNDAMQAVYREIFSATRSVEKALTVACLGPEGTFSHIAALKLFGASASYSFERRIDSVFSCVEKGKADFGVAPIENSLEGPIAQTLDLLMNTPLSVYGELYLTVGHNLLSNEKDISSVQKLYTHYMPLAQSRKWITANLPDVPIIETLSSAEAVAIAAKEKGAAAIGAMEAAKLYKINILASRIEDTSQNQTRFFVIARAESPRSGSDKTSLAITVKDSPGSLFKILKPFSDRKINLLKIESRPIKTSEWEYVFYIDLEGHRLDKKVREALAKLETLTRTLKILGSYPDARA